MTARSKEPEIRKAMSGVWRNLQDGTTFSACGNGCKDKWGRGGGPCIDCYEKELAGLTSIDDAKHFVACVRAVKKSESKLTEFRRSQ